MDIHDFFNNIDATKIDEFISEGREEDLHLDFKLLNEPRMNRDDRKNLAKALSGFANADGGIIVWGVDARPNGDQINCAVGTQQISPLSAFVSRINEFTGTMVNPTVDGVEHHAITVQDDSGFLVTLIPASNTTPHMAKGGEDRYYKRSGDSFFKMEHYEVEDMFGRRPKPQLDLAYRIAPGNRSGHSRQVLGFYIFLSIKNDGKGAARAPYLDVKFDGPCRFFSYGIDGNGNEGLNRLTSASDYNGLRYGAMDHMVIHPGVEHTILALHGSFDPDKPFNHLKIDYKIAAEGVPLTTRRLEIEVNTLIREIEAAYR